MGSGTQVQDIGRLIKQHKQMQKMMKKVTGKGGMAKMMRGMGGMFPGGRMPKVLIRGCDCTGLAPGRARACVRRAGWLRASSKRVCKIPGIP